MRRIHFSGEYDVNGADGTTRPKLSLDIEWLKQRPDEALVRSALGLAESQAAARCFWVSLASTSANSLSVVVEYVGVMPILSIG